MDPPPGKLLISTSERVEFLYDQDGPLVNDQATCSNLMRQIRGGTRRMPEVTELAFLDNFSESARADSTVSLLYEFVRLISVLFFFFDLQD